MKVAEKQTVLVVDDATENIDVIVGLLKDHYRVKAAVNGMKALKIIESKPPDLILLDIMMPEMDGLEVIRRLKANPATSEIPVIFLTGKTDATDETKGFELGAVDYISKPFNPAVVKARVDTQMELVSRRRETERLLSNILPEKVIADLKESGASKPELFPNVTVFFSDFVDFTKLSAETAPETLISELSDIFTSFDDIIERNDCERIKTIGDAYLAVCGMPNENPDHAANLIRAGLEMISFLERRNATFKLKWRARVGIHSGPVVGGIVGVKKYLYDIFGDTVNTASRVECASEPMRVTISQATRDLASEAFAFTPLGPVELKGKGAVELFTVD
ncbi:MAG: response regulator [Kiritimatiellaeota bacterium]|nr:response regulator [Kiritimatiellota bacterium]